MNKYAYIFTSSAIYFYASGNACVVLGIPRTTHSPDTFAVGFCMRNASVICRGKLLPPRA
jgi:hypothetical protein